MDTTMVNAPARRTRRRHSAEFRASVIEACRQPGVSMAAVALANGLNANMLRKWVQEADHREVSVPIRAEGAPALAAVGGFVPLSTPVAAVKDIRIELQRSGTTVTVHWPSGAAAECAAWLREVLR